jgi:hypothetical protein
VKNPNNFDLILFGKIKDQVLFKVLYKPHTYALEQGVLEVASLPNVGHINKLQKGFITSVLKSVCCLKAVLRYVI